MKFLPLRRFGKDFYPRSIVVLRKVSRLPSAFVTFARMLEVA